LKPRWLKSCRGFSFGWENKSIPFSLQLPKIVLKPRKEKHIFTNQE